MEKIRIPDPSWGSDLANIILDLEKHHYADNTKRKNIYTQICQQLPFKRCYENFGTQWIYI